MKIKIISLLVPLLLLIACQPKPTGLSIDGVWARPGKSGDNSAAYFTINNLDGQGDSLLSASTDVAQAAELHMSMMQGGAITMQRQDQVDIPVSGKVEFRPGGLHVMLIGLNRDLKAGDTFTLTLTFANTGSRVLTVTVEEQ
jgi:copper(I)-binding protein